MIIITIHLLLCSAWKSQIIYSFSSLHFLFSPQNSVKYIAQLVFRWQHYHFKCILGFEITLQKFQCNVNSNAIGELDWEKGPHEFDLTHTVMECHIPMWTPSLEIFGESLKIWLLEIWFALLILRYFIIIYWRKIRI